VDRRFSGEPGEGAARRSISPHEVRESWDEGSAERQAAASGLSEGSLSALRARRYIEPLPLAYRLFRGTPKAPGRDGPGLSNPGGGQTSP
jgi:hypothetical protein